MTDFQYEYKKRKLSRQQTNGGSSVSFKIPMQTPLSIQATRKSLKDIMNQRIKSMFQARSRISRQIAAKSKKNENLMRINKVKENLREIQNLNDIRLQAQKEVEKFRDFDEESRQILNQTIQDVERERIQLDIERNQIQLQEAQGAFNDAQERINRTINQSLQQLIGSLVGIPEIQQRLNDTILHLREREAPERQQQFENILREFQQQQNIQVIPEEQGRAQRLKQNLNQIQRNNAEILQLMDQMNRLNGGLQVEQLEELDDALDRFEGISSIQNQGQQGRQAEKLNNNQLFMQYYKIAEEMSPIYLNQNAFDRILNNALFGPGNTSRFPDIVLGSDSNYDRMTSQIQGKKQLMARNYRDQEVHQYIQSIKMSDHNTAGSDIQESQGDLLGIMQFMEDRGMNVPAQRPTNSRFDVSQLPVSQHPSEYQIVQQQKPPTKRQVRTLLYFLIKLCSIGLQKAYKQAPPLQDQRLTQTQEQDLREGQKQIFESEVQNAQRNLQKPQSQLTQIQEQEFEERKEDPEGQGRDDPELRSLRINGNGDLTTNGGGVSAKEFKQMISKTFLNKIPHDIITLEDVDSDWDTKLSNEDLASECFICFLLDISLLDDSLQEDSWHWICMYVNDHSIELYDPFGQYYPENVLRFAEEIADNGFVQRKIKGSTVQQQIDTTDSCAYFCMWFLMQRVQDIPFDKATYYKSKSYREKQMSKLRRNINNLGMEETSKHIQEQLQQN